MDEDISLIDEFLQGNESSFNRLVLKHQKRVFNIIYAILSNYEETNEAAQDVFVSVYRSLKNFRKESNFATWLYRIAVNQARNRYNKVKRIARVTYSIDDPIYAEEGEIERSIPDTNTAVNELEKKELNRKISDSISQIPMKYKEVVILRDVEGMDYMEIQNVTGLNEGTIKSRLHRGRCFLKDLLKKAGT